MPDDRPILVLTAGSPNSGKSAWAADQSRRSGAALVSVEAIRQVAVGRDGSKLLVWGMADAMVRTLFAAGYRGVILDAGNYTRAQRDRWKHVGARVLVKVFPRPETTAEVEWEAPGPDEELLTEANGNGFWGIPKAEARR